MKSTPVMDQLIALSEQAIREKRTTTKIVLGSTAAIDLAEELRFDPPPWPDFLPKDAEIQKQEKEWLKRDSEMRKALFRNEMELALPSGFYRVFVVTGEGYSPNLVSLE